MAQITVKYDPTFPIEPIEEPMYATSENECSEDRPAEVQQTKITGILSPLIKVNNILILWDKVTKFELSSTRFLPELSFTFKDDLGFTKSLDQPGNDNLVLVQILPPFENAYKKITLRFFIDSVRIVGSKVSITAKYNIPELYQDKLQALGEMSTYDYIDYIAKTCKLGLAANVDGTEDKRYIYIRNTNFIKSLEHEIQISGSETAIYDTWIDLRNYIILCDMYERYNANDSDLKVWTSGTCIPETENTGKEITAKEEDAILSNAIGVRNSQLFITDYTVGGNSGKNMKLGTDKIVQSYYMNNGEASSILIQDGDTKRDTYLKTIYRGEVFGNYDYFASELCRTAFLQKINTNTIQISLMTPLLGLERGGRVNLLWYESNEIASVIKKENPIETNISNIDSETDDDTTTMTLNKQVSGQYMIIGTTIRFNGFNRGWQYILTLSRPADQINTYLEENE